MQPRKLYILVGIPGAGKTTYARRHLEAAVRVSMDDLRLMMSGVDWDARYEPIVHEAARAMLDSIAAGARRWGVDVVFDATNVTRAFRREAIDRARRHGLVPVCVYFDVPLDQALERNLARTKVVPEDVLRRFRNRLEPPTEDEGFAELIVVRPGGAPTADC